MTDKELADLLMQAAPLVDADSLSEVPGGWCLMFDPDLGLDIELDSAAPRLVLTGAASPLPQPSSVERLELMLAYNALWATHGGVRLALDPADRQVLLLLDVPLQNLDLPTLASVLSGFSQLQRGWRAALDAPSVAKAVDMIPGDAGTLLGLGVIRG